MKSILIFICILSLFSSGLASYNVTYETLPSLFPTKNQTTLIFMHGAGETADYYVNLHRRGLFPKSPGVKIMFLQSHLKQGDKYPWMRMDRSKAHMEPDSRSTEDADKQCESIVEIIREEITTTYGFLNFTEGAKRIYIGGKSQGALLSLYLQLMKLETTVGGVALLSGFPLKPLYEMTYPNVTKTEARERCTNLQQNMRFFIWHGTADPIFEQTRTFELYDELFKKLGISNTIKTMHAEPGLGHKTSKTEIEHLMKFIDETSSELGLKELTVEDPESQSIYII